MTVENEKKWYRPAVTKDIPNWLEALNEFAFKMARNSLTVGAFWYGSNITGNWSIFVVAAF